MKRQLIFLFFLLPLAVYSQCYTIKVQQNNLGLGAGNLPTSSYVPSGTNGLITTSSSSFTFTLVGGSTNIYTIKSNDGNGGYMTYSTSNILDPYGNIYVSQSSATNGDNQKWVVTNLGNGYNKISPYSNTSLVWNLYGAGGGSYQKVICLYAWGGGGSNEIFSLTSSSNCGGCTSPQPTVSVSSCTGTNATLTAGNCPSGTITWSNGAVGLTTTVGNGTYTATCTNPMCTPSIPSATATVSCGTGGSSSCYTINVQQNNLGLGAGNLPTSSSVPSGTNGLITTSSSSFTFTLVGGSTNIYTIKSSDGNGGYMTYSTSNILDPYGNIYVSQSSATNGDNQKWVVTNLGNGYNKISPYSNTSLVWNLYGAGGGSYQKVICLYAWGGGGSNEIFSLTSSSNCGGCTSPQPTVSVSSCTGTNATLTAGNCPSGTITWSNGAVGLTTTVGNGTYTATCTNPMCTPSIPSATATVSCGTGGSSSCYTINVQQNNLGLGAGNLPTSSSVPSGTNGLITTSSSSFTFTLVGGSTNIYTIKSSDGNGGYMTYSTSNILDPYGNIYVSQSSATNGDNQKWVVTNLGNGYNKISPYSNTSLVWNLYGAGGGSYQKVICLYAWGGGGSNEIFSLTSSSNCGGCTSPQPIVSVSSCTGTNAALTAGNCPSGTITWSNGAVGLTTTVGNGTYTATCTNPMCTPSIPSATATVSCGTGGTIQQPMFFIKSSCETINSVAGANHKFVPYSSAYGNANTYEYMTTNTNNVNLTTTPAIGQMFISNQNISNNSGSITYQALIKKTGYYNFQFNYYDATCDHYGQSTNCPTNISTLTVVNNSTGLPLTSPPTVGQVLKITYNNENNWYQQGKGIGWYDTPYPGCFTNNGQNDASNTPYIIITVNSIPFHIQAQPFPFKDSYGNWVNGGCHGWLSFNFGSTSNGSTRMGYTQDESLFFEKENESILLYPNTANLSTIFSLKTVENKGNAVVEIYDINGLAVYSQEVSFINNLIDGNLEIGKLNAGQYLVRITTKDKVYSKRLIKE